MSTDQNKALCRRCHDEVFNQGKLNVADEIIAPDFIWYGPGLPPDMPRGPDGVKIFATLLRTAFPDLKLATEASIAEGDSVVNRWIFRGTHKGAIMGILPTGKKVKITGVDIFRVRANKIIENRQEWDLLGLLQQLGAAPPSIPVTGTQSSPSSKRGR